jgi:hypothetical protein
MPIGKPGPNIDQKYTLKSTILERANEEKDIGVLWVKFLTVPPSPRSRCHVLPEFYKRSCLSIIFVIKNFVQLDHVSSFSLKLKVGSFSFLIMEQFTRGDSISTNDKYF